MIKTALACTLTAAVGLVNVSHDFHQAMPQPVQIIHEDPALTEVRQALRILGRDESFAHDIVVTARAKQINPLLWCANIERESEFKRTARSNKGYVGLGQTPKAVMRMGYDTADLMLAACIFAEKRRITKGDVAKALQLYKGGNNPAAKKEADKVFALYDKLKKQIAQQAIEEEAA